MCCLWIYWWTIKILLQKTDAEIQASPKKIESNIAQGWHAFTIKPSQWIKHSQNRIQQFFEFNLFWSRWMLGDHRLLFAQGWHLKWLRLYAWENETTTTHLKVSRISDGIQRNRDLKRRIYGISRQMSDSITINMHHTTKHN